MVAMTIDGRPAITSTEAAHRLGKSVMQVFRGAKSGMFKTIRLNALLIDEQDFAARLARFGMMDKTRIILEHLRQFAGPKLQRAVQGWGLMQWCLVLVHSLDTARF